MLEILLVVAILSLIASIVSVNLISMVGSAETAAEETEKDNLQLAVHVLLADSGVHGLDASYDEIQTLSDIQAVSANGHTLDQYVSSVGLQLMQAYDISKDGEVTVD